MVEAGCVLIVHSMFDIDEEASPENPRAIGRNGSTTNDHGSPAAPLCNFWSAMDVSLDTRTGEEKSQE